MNQHYELNEKVAAWEQFYAEAQEEKDLVEKTGLADIEQVKQDKVRHKEAPAAVEIKISMHMKGGAKPQTRAWKKPTASELSNEIPAIITRALRAAARSSMIATAQVPDPGSRNRYWKKKFEAAGSKVAYGMLMLTNAQNGKAVPMPPLARAEPVALPVASINENTNLDPNHKPGEMG
jgi:hypothetical protein